MKNKLKNFVKNNNFIYKLYYYIFGFLIKFISLFVKVKSNKVLFVSYGGKKYDDSPKVIYEYLKNNKEYSNFKLKWAFIHKEEYPSIPESDKMTIDTLKYYIYALQAKYWITNSSVQRGINFKRKENKNILFMHGLTALKKSSKDFNSKGKQFKMVKAEYFDKVFIEGKKEKNIVLQNINVEEQNLFNYGLPRCDELININNDQEQKKKIKKELKIPTNKRVILYAPTYREYDKTAFSGIITKPKLTISKWKEALNNEYVLLITSHYEIGNDFDFKFDNKFIFDVSKYNSINELLAISDILITDYSNIVFDYTILGKPVLCYGYDYKKYQKEGRGFYNKLENIYKDGVIETEDELLSKIKNMNYKEESNHSKKICNEFILHYGDATEKCVKEIFR